MKITDIAKNMACMLLLAYAATVAAQENTASFLYRLNGDFNDGTFSSGKKTRKVAPYIRWFQREKRF